MAKTYLSDGVNLDSAWLRRVRGKLTDPEIVKAKETADEDVKVWLRFLYGFESDSHEDLERIEDDDGEPIDVSAIVLDDLFHRDGSNFLDRLTHPDYVRISQLAEVIASFYLLQWGDFMGDAGSDEPNQQTQIGNTIRRMKAEIEMLGSLKTTDDASIPDRYYFQKRSPGNTRGMTMRRRVRR